MSASARGRVSDALRLRLTTAGVERRQVFAVEVARGPRVDQEPVPPQNHHRLDTFALSEGPNEVVDGGQ